MMPKVQRTSSDSNRNRRIDARSCLGCHRRKVRCDRGVPCTNCARAGCTCIYPSKPSDERRSPSLQHISDRLERVESIISHLCESRASGFAAGGDSETQGRHETNQLSSAQHSHMPWEVLLNDGQMVQYVNNANIKDLLQDEERMKVTRSSSPEREFSHRQPENTPMLAAQPESLADTSCAWLESYPDPQLALRLWSVYVNSVDPVLKILHIPTTQSAVIATILDPKSAGSSMVALTFAIYFAAITALGHHNEPELFLDKSVLLKRYKAALDRLLINTEVMNRPEITALQALAIYVTCLRVHETARSTWVLNGLTIRLAQSIGLHRDGAHLQLSPFDAEMRLRLWWHLCVLDSRAPEDQGFELTLDVMNRGLRLPLNIDDDQIFPSMTQLPEETDGWTEMSFFLIQTESCRLIHPVLGTRGPSSVDALPEITAKRKMILERSQQVAMKYRLSSSSKSPPSNLPRITMQHFTTAHKKMEFMLQLREEIGTQKGKGSRSHRADTDDDSSHTVFRPSFRLACESLESNSILLKGSFSSGFKWLFTTYTPWYALAYVLRCLCSCPCGGEAERAWALVDAVFSPEMSFDGKRLSSEGALPTHAPGRTQTQTKGQSSLWNCLSLLRSQALSLKRAQSQSQPRSSSTNSGEMQPPRLVDDPLYGGTAPSPTLTEMPAPGISSPLHTDFEVFHSEQPFLADGTGNPNILSGADFEMPGIPFLPEWNAVINGCLAGEGDFDL
ncbi:hypothetical protein P170DRAFT_2424 [Aspergillus steynii IBT 23096]|uniref:Zn(2)-C6 fungal-type domain-containing protein n=1 Tax=Aspergillus steynii IBT 23096 TaxID=1392250 RepID=A0A2I2GLE2_9EURO|nr:uncharacterized protein P170DRAFT_2424 [Aspergillus steynii IBT 23096]PLB53696.1 hypothetical protein P170DRAFT_2424 [Aspergillus steynii IBT 23096]